ncbi:YitT family protein [Desulfosporosinus sp. BICA1-9]|uniref:YczE/YyaS/YitT family protein n=1 Tax=Desulfosporosinus sp. BICA1-9 TaxID=1531958 RepID=UPI00054BA249|nr:membrane protein [Desulfosporosinus sp. BICA1-9]KJS89215.1 MAG: membrane protein [Desulfosporosinus sp. BICA1-9]
MKQIVKQVVRLFIGIFLYAVGIVLTINANLGLAPWDVFHQGMTKLISITMGEASIAVGIILVIFNSVLGERLGWGTLCNMLFIGLFIDLLMLNHIIPIVHGIILGVVMMFLGMVVIGVASYFYISAELGSGPRDGLMIALTKKTGKSVRFIRNAIELSALMVGYLLGGFVGIGTLIMAIVLGYIIQFTFKVFKFDVRRIRHRFIDQDFKDLKEKLAKRKLSNLDL